MPWSKTPPEVPGLYWVRYPDDVGTDDEFEIIEIPADEEELGYLALGEDVLLSLSELLDAGAEFHAARPPVRVT